MSLHDKILAIPFMRTDLPNSDTRIACKLGHRDARHAAAELALEQDVLVVDLVETLEAWLATDPSFNSTLDRHLDELIAEGKSVRLATLVKLSRAVLAKYKGEQS